MHEISIMAEAVNMAVQAAQDAGAQKVTGLRLRVGAMSGAVPEALRFAWDVVCAGTLAEGAWLEIDSVPATWWCPACLAEYVCDDWMGECPRCHQASGDLRRGRELEIAAVEVN